MNNKVIYTAIFGDYDYLEPSKYVPKGFDFICFTDGNLKSDFWEVRKVLPLYKDSTRTARKYKILPHRFLQEYDNSIWIDGNFLIKDDVNILWDEYMWKNSLSAYSHMHCFEKRNCIYEEARMIKYLFEINKSPNKKPKDDLIIIEKQMKKYFEKKYPQNNGLISSGILLRKHNDENVKKIMEDWWLELKYGSKRDQLSFNYVCWMNNFNFEYINDDIRENKYFILNKHNHQK
jgi:hypothetical protein